MLNQLQHLSNFVLQYLNQYNFLEIVKEKSATLSKFSFSEDETLNHGDVALSLGGIEIEDIIEKRISPTPIETYEENNIIP